ncbi:MAG: hypothetical protein GXO36_04660 [Chloroflexi bacterium]|nr:hypothetical protein [Chloroflexota bacterium]
MNDTRPHLPQILDEDLAAYALGALPPEEAEVVRRAIQRDPDLARRLREYQNVVWALHYAAPPVPPPPVLRERILARVRSRRAWGLPRAWPAWGWAKRWAWALAAFVVGWLALQVPQWMGTHPPATDAPMVEVALQGEMGEGHLQFHPGDTVAYLYVKLPPLPEGQAYQFWLVKPDQTRDSGAVFAIPPAESTPLPDGHYLIWVRAPQPLEHYIAFGITIEPATGSPAPTGPRVLFGSLADR